MKSLNWKEAENHLKEVEEAYKELIGMKNVNPYFALEIISAYRKRFDKGERTKELYDEIMGLK